MKGWSARAAALVIGLGLSASAPALADGTCGPLRGETGQFDFYLYSLSWSPAFCAKAKPDKAAEQCAASPAPGFVVHGLWPQYADGSWPQCCATRSPYRPDAVPGALKGVMIGESLRSHEWDRHGRCAAPSPEAYFATIADAVGRFGLAPTLRVPDSGRISLTELKRHWPVPPEAIVPHCRGKQLVEIRVCLTRDLSPLPCPAAVRDADSCPGTVSLARSPSP